MSRRLLFFEETEDSIFYREQAVFLIFVSFFRCNFYLGSNPNLLVWVSLVASLTSPFMGGHEGHMPGPGPRSWGAAPTSLMKHTPHPVGEIGGHLRHPPPRSGWRWCSQDPAGRPSVKLKAEPTLKSWLWLPPWVQANRLPGAPRRPQAPLGNLPWCLRRGGVGPERPPGTGFRVTPVGATYSPPWGRQGVGVVGLALLSRAGGLVRVPSEEKGR